jgi:hypothetical protein
MRWFIYLIFSLLMQLVALVVTPLLPPFARDEFGWTNNNSGSGVEPRLPHWLRWFDTLDNSLLGDENWKATHDGGYWSRVAWLYRNMLYGLKWTVLAAPVTQTDVWWEGDPSINKNNGRYGFLRVRMGKYWEIKIVRKLFGGYGLMLDIGWLLNPYCTNAQLHKTQPLALFQFSPRLFKVKP